MKINNFFKTLNKKINEYDKMAHNPFAENGRLVVVWIEEYKKTDNSNSSRFFE